MPDVSAPARGALRWLRARPTVLVETVRRIRRQDLTAAVVVAAVWFGALVLLDATPYWYPVSLSRYWFAGWWIVGTVLLRQAAPVGTFWCTVLAYPVLYEAKIVNELHLLPLLVVAVSVMLVRGLPPAVVAVVSSLAVVVMSFGSVDLLWLVRSGGWDSLVSTQYMGFFFDPSDTVTRVALVLAATVIGTVLGRLHETRRALQRRNAQLIALREVRAREAVRTERTRIARELHDVVAHHVAAIVVRAQAADRVADDDPEQPREAVRWIAANGREALDAMRSVVRVLREDERTPVVADDPTSMPSDGLPAVPLAPTPTLAELPAVIARVAEAGVRVDARLPDPVPDLPPATVLTVLRVAQEALTNVLLHSRAQQVALTLELTAGGVRLTVHDDGPPRAVEPVTSVGGHGLLHMAERAGSMGGTLSAGPDGPGYLVVLEIPVLVVAERERDREPVVGP
ncbi:MAG: histidine kinase [Cellulomonas sp.]|nr:histidine kinase [Cellulomonas sp.]